MTLNTGKYKDYFWLQTDDMCQKDVLEQCANFRLGKYLAVTAFDSGELAISLVELQADWKMDSGIALSPKLNHFILNDIPYAGFDEWFFLEKNKIIQVKELFVNYALFNLGDEQVPELFWNQISEINPYAYVADGMQLTVVSKDEKMMGALR